MLIVGYRGMEARNAIRFGIPETGSICDGDRFATNRAPGLPCR
jgi:hypothetical protein